MAAEQIDPHLKGGQVDMFPDPGSKGGAAGGQPGHGSVQPRLPGFPAGTIPGGWPNGRRFGDDVVDIAVTAAISDLRGDPLVINGPAGDSVDANDIAYNKVFPYAATPLHARSHAHNGIAETASLDFAHFGSGEGLVSEIVLTNPSTTTTVDRIPLHLYLNAFANQESTWMRTTLGRMVDVDDLLILFANWTG